MKQYVVCVQDKGVDTLSRQRPQHVRGRTLGFLEKEERIF